MKHVTWKLAVGLALWVGAYAWADTPVPKELEAWQAWVQDGQEFRRCPFLASSDGSQESDRICAWPGRLNLELTQSGGRFTQTWTVYAEGWVPLPGNLEFWPSEVTINGVAAAVVAREGVPQIRAGEGTLALAGHFAWLKRPETLAVPEQTGLVSLALDGRKVEQAGRPAGAVVLGVRQAGPEAHHVELQVYRLLSDGIPVRLTTELHVQIAGDVREETVPKILPPGFEAMSIDSALPALLGPDGRLRIQARAGSWTIKVEARATADPVKIRVPDAQGIWPKQEVWSYAADDRLRVAALGGVEGIDPAQANVPEAWRANPSYRVAAGGVVQLNERSRGMSAQELNHLNLQRELYLDFTREGFTVVDQISGQMRSGWRLDMQAPYRLMRAAAGEDDLLITAGDGALTGVELRTPQVSLRTVARVASAGGSMPASGWTERFDHVSGVLNLPSGHRLFAALGADDAAGAWIERWGLLDLFLLFFTTVIAMRLLGWRYALVAGAAIVLVHQEDSRLVWLILFVLLASLSLRAAPPGWPRTAAWWGRNILLGAWMLTLVPFAAEQVRFALYPQLADGGGYELQERSLAPGGGAVLVTRQQDFVPVPRRSLNAPAAAPPPRLQEIMVTSAKRASASLAESRVPRERFAPGTLVQAGPGIPDWRFATYTFNWSGPVDASQTVHFLILPPWLVGLWRVLGVGLLIALLVRVVSNDTELQTGWRRWFTLRRAAASMAGVLACTMLCTPSRASDTPDTRLLDELKTRLTRPPKCVPNCAEIMAARVAVAAGHLEADLEVAALNTVAVALPSGGPRIEPDAISVDGIVVAGVYRDGDQLTWIAVKPGAHAVKWSARLPAANSVQLVFPQVPRQIAVSADGWDVSGVNAGKLLGNTLELVRRRTAGHDDEPLAAAQFAPYVRVRREFAFDLDWSLTTTVERLAPQKGGFTLQIPLLAGESVLTRGIETQNGTAVLAGFDSGAQRVSWQSTLPPTDSFALAAAKDKPWSEVWIFRVSPLWRVEFSGVPPVMPENSESGEWRFEYFPREGEALGLKVSRPTPAKGGTLAIDRVEMQYDVGKRASNTMLQFNYRSTRGDRQSVKLPTSARVTSVNIDGRTFPVRLEGGELPLALLPGAHRVQIDWQSDSGIAPVTRLPQTDLHVASSNIGSVVRLPEDRWVLYAGGNGVGPAILYWGELIVFVVLAVALGRTGRAPLPIHEWLLLGLGLSTFSWSALLLFAVWMFAMRWRESLAVGTLGARKFNLLQVGLIVLSLAAVLALVAAIPFGLLATPDMRIAGGQQAHELSWFNDQAAGVLPTPWVLSLSLWWYKAAMLLWALWLAFALVRWLPIAWRALGAGGFWRGVARAPAPQSIARPAEGPRTD